MRAWVTHIAKDHRRNDEMETQVIHRRVRSLFCPVLLMVLLATGAQTPIVHAQVQCWVPRQNEGLVTDPRWARQLKAMSAAETIVKQSQEFLNPPVPVRMRTTMAISRHEPTGSRLIVHAYPEHTSGGIGIWKGDCGIIPQVERVAASIGRISVFFNHISKEMFMGPDELPKLTGTRDGYPEYNGWVVISKNGRLPWIPQTLGDRLDRIGAAREKALGDWRHAKASRKAPDRAMVDKTAALLKMTDPSAADQYVENMKRLTADIHAGQAKDAIRDAQLTQLLNEYRTYRASFTAQQLAMPAVWADTEGSGRQALEAQITELQTLSVDDQERVGELREQSRVLEREAAVNVNDVAALQLRAKARDLLQDADHLRKDHLEHAALKGEALRDTYELINLKPGSADQALAYKLDPAFPNRSQQGKIHVIAVSVLPQHEDDVLQRPEQAARKAWLDQVKPSINYAALAALLD